MALSSRRLPPSAGLIKLHFFHISPLRRQHFTQSSSVHAAWRGTTVFPFAPIQTPRGNPNTALHHQNSRLDLLRSPSLLSMVQKRTAHSSKKSSFPPKQPYSLPKQQFSPPKQQSSPSNQPLSPSNQPFSPPKQPSSPFVSYWRQYKAQIVTWTTVGLCTAVFCYQQWAKEQAKRHNNLKPMRFIAENFVLNLPNLQAGRWWTLITYSFMHFTPLHLTVNCFCLMSFGPMIASCFGTTGFIVGWWGSALVAGASSLLWETRARKSGRASTGAVGASGSLFGFTAMIACFNPTQPVSFMLIPYSFPMWGFLATAVGISLTFMANEWLPFVGHAGHLGGMAFGALYYATRLRRKRLPRF